MTTQSTWIGLRLDPLDTLFFRDGRPFDAANRVVSGMPTPQTLAGAIRTALLAADGFFAKHPKPTLKLILEEANEGITKANFRGPWLALADGIDGRASPLLSMPETLRRANGGSWSIAKPIKKIPGWNDPDSLYPLWRKDEANPKAEVELLTTAGLNQFLAGKMPSDGESLNRNELTSTDHRIGIEIHKDTLTSVEGMLYSIGLLATKPKHDNKPICLYAEIELPLEQAKYLTDTLVPFGGEGKYVRVRKQEGSEFDKLVKPSTIGPALWYLATPTFFDPNHRP